jgi:hypothetical protein
MSMQDTNPPAQGSSSSTDIVTQLSGIVRQLSNWIQAFNGRITQGNFTLSVAASITVAQPAVAANSFIQWSPTNASAGTLEGSAKKLYLSAKSPGVSFTLSTASGGNAVGTETFDYQISSTF